MCDKHLKSDRKRETFAISCNRVCNRIIQIHREFTPILHYQFVQGIERMGWRHINNVCICQGSTYLQTCQKNASSQANIIYITKASYHVSLSFTAAKYFLQNKTQWSQVVCLFPLQHPIMQLYN